MHEWIEHSPLTVHQVTLVQCVFLTFAWAHMQAVSGPCKSPLCEETPSGSGAGQAAAGRAQPAYCHVLCPWSYALHLHTHHTYTFIHTYSGPAWIHIHKHKTAKSAHIHPDMFVNSWICMDRTRTNMNTHTEYIQELVMCLLIKVQKLWAYRCHSLTDCRTSQDDVQASQRWASLGSWLFLQCLNQTWQLLQFFM